MSKLIDFKNQSLNLDYLTFNLPNSRQRIEEFGLIFFKYGFNSKVYDDKIDTTRTLFQDESLNCTLTFRLEKESWFMIKHRNNSFSTKPAYKISVIKGWM